MLQLLLPVIGLCIPAILLFVFKNRRRIRMDSQGKYIGLFMVIFIVGVCVIMTSYQGVLWIPFRMHGFRQTTTEVVSGIKEDSNSIIMEEKGDPGTNKQAPQLEPPAAGDKGKEIEEIDGVASTKDKEMKEEMKNIKEEIENLKEDLKTIKASKSKETKDKESINEGVNKQTNKVDINNNDIKENKEKKTEESGEIFYGIMFDAGSTGSRIHAFQFEKRGEGKPAKLLDELFEYNKKGLSSFQDAPKEGAESLRPMLESAKKYIPESKWSSTPIALKATAGLRLLPQEKADALLNAVRAIFAEYQYKMGKDAVQIMDGDEEGVFSWFTFNFLTGALGDPEKMVGVMDLGGGSTQVTYVPIVEETIKNAPEDYLTDIDIFGKNVKLYSHSYLGLGLMAARFQTIGGIDKPNSEETNPSNFTSPCFPQNHTEVFDYQGKNYTIRGANSSLGLRFEACYKEALRVVEEHKILTDVELKLKNFSIISYYYDKAEDAGLIDPKEGGTIKVKDYFESAFNVCSTRHRKPFLCLDLTYMGALLHGGFGFNKEKKLLLKKKISGTEISWALGAMFQLFNESPPPK